jgi:hypothetical protein
VQPDEAGNFFLRRSIRPDAFAADMSRAAGLPLRGRLLHGTSVAFPCGKGRDDMNNIIYLIGLVVVVVAVLAFFGLR